MEAGFWHDRWKTGQLGFHEGQVNRMLAAHLGALGLTSGARIFLPLCGKTRDIAWLRSQGYRVAGAELSDVAVRQLFDELDVKPVIARKGDLTLYAAPGLDIFVGDIFDLTAEQLGAVDAVYDRAALVALPEDMRRKYATHLTTITGTAPQLLVTFEYDQTLMEGPPFSISEEGAAQFYQADFHIAMLDKAEVPGGLKGRCPAWEKALLLRPLE
ncbi:thiopurine S-methyltransferase [Roseovarius autotrophicus]|uniref:thiopurine S-methyltransferase n=1 Tax=Roseovarius autotrophicus TaxID=2824121 RepID=UPI0019F79DC7|nr:thiopurine S-methyltransferase [Roseovarius autotrophicus]MBE0453447.1 thiopurine S-methyltransferase [Roseovarius sp.]